MKHGTLVRKKVRKVKYVSKTVFDWEMDPWLEKIVFGPIYSYSYEPDGWDYYGPTFRYRYDPVPGISTGNNSVRSCVRHMKTTQERRWACAHKEYIRGRRSYINLPSDYDDYWHSDRGRGWKRSKKKRQWMKIGDKLNHKIDYGECLTQEEIDLNLENYFNGQLNKL